jgi:hypothetical protein
MRLANNARIASCMKSPPYLSLSNSKLFETSPNHYLDLPSTLSHLWSKLHCSNTPPSCPLVFGRGKKWIHEKFV